LLNCERIELAPSDKGKCPVQGFAFVKPARRRVEMTAADGSPQKRRECRLREFVELESKGIPEDILFEADRLECRLYSGYDPSFDGDETPGL
jgi:hypothetical protein